MISISVARYCNGIWKGTDYLEFSKKDDFVNNIKMSFDMSRKTLGRVYQRFISKSARIYDSRYLSDMDELLSTII